MRNSFFTMLAVVCGLGAIASAQPSPPHIGYVYPAGGKQGTTFEVTVGGQFLDGAATVHLTGKDIDATVIEHIKPINQGQVNKLREQLDDLRKKPSTPEIQKEMDDIRKKIAIFFNRSSSMAVVETVTMKVTVGKDAAPGERELRLACSTGLSNPLVFEVGQLQEFSRDPSWKTADDRIPNFRFKAPGEPRTGPPPPPTDVALPAIVNGQIMPSAVDRFRFQAKKGQRLVIAVEARKLIPYIADAVPGWFQAAITLYDPSGREVAFADHFRFDPDPVLCYQVPGDGQYSLDIRDSIYRGREDFIYRITMGELPYITSICPLGGHAGKETPVEIRGWNLGAGTRMAATGATADKNLQIATLTFDGRLSAVGSQRPVDLKLRAVRRRCDARNADAQAQRPLRHRPASRDACHRQRVHRSAWQVGYLQLPRPRRRGGRRRNHRATAQFFLGFASQAARCLGQSAGVQ
jgi:hypothetical protein